MHDFKIVEIVLKCYNLASDIRQLSGTLNSELKVVSKASVELFKKLDIVTVVCDLGSFIQLQ